MICAAAAVIMFPMNVGAEEEKHTESYVLMEASTGTVIRERDSDVRVHMGSFNKLMTVLLAAEAVDRGEISMDTLITAGENANSRQGAQIWLAVGEKMTLEELLKGIIIGNANDACCAVAERLGGTEEHFAEMMNSRAAELSMKDTLFTESTGYYDDGEQYTTARDAGKLLCELYRHDELREMFTTRLDEIKDGQVMLVTTNKPAYKYNGSVGFKCGGGKQSGYFAAEGAERDGMGCVCAVMDCGDEDYSMALARELLDIAFEGYTIIKPEIPKDMPEKLKVKEGVAAEVRLSVRMPETLIVPKGRKEDITAEIVLPSYIYAPVRKGDKAGKLRIYNGKKLLVNCDVNAAEDVRKKNMIYMLYEMMKYLVKF